MPPSAVAALRDHLDQEYERRVAAGTAWQQAGLVFTTRTGGPIHPRNDYRSFQALLERAGIRRVPLHDLRHTTASPLLAQGVHSRIVMEILGHSQISVTMNTYSHVAPEVSREAAAKIEEALSPHG